MAVREAEPQPSFVLPDDWMLGRKKVTGICADGPKTLDCDDAVTLHTTPDGKIQTVSISDTTVLPSRVQGRALAKGATIYDAEGPVMSMLAKNISQGVLSLGLTALQPTISAETEFDPVDGEVRGFRIYRSYIESSRVTYDEVNRMLKDRGDPAAIKDENEMFREMFWTLRKAKLAKGMRVRNAETLIAAAMISSNILTARFCAEKQVPILYRAYHGADPISFADEIKHGYYTPWEIEHAQFKSLYAHTTSPLRRGADMVNQRQLVAALTDKRDEMLEYPDLLKLGGHLTCRYRAAQGIYVRSVRSVQDGGKQAA